MDIGNLRDVSMYALSPAPRRILITNRVRDSVWYFLVFQLLDRYQDYFDSRRTVVQL